MVDIVANKAAGQQRAARKALVDSKAEQAVALLDGIIADMDGSPTNADVIAAVKTLAQIQKRVVRYIQRTS